MLLSALLALSTVQQKAALPYHMVVTTEAKSPHSPEADLIASKRKAYEFFFLVKEGAPKPLSIRNLNWRSSNVVVIYPGLVQRDAKVKLIGVKRTGSVIHVTIDTRRGISAETHYPIL